MYKRQAEKAVGATVGQATGSEADAGGEGTEESPADAARAIGTGAGGIIKTGAEAVEEAAGFLPLFR